MRGAVGFSLVTILDEDNPFKDIFLTTTLFVIFFTVFIQGSTIKLVVAKLNIQTKSTEVFNYHILQMITSTAVTTFKLNKTSNIIQTKAMKGNETVISKV